MKLSRMLAGAAAVLALTTPGRAQQVTLNFDDVAQCNGPLATYGGWIAIASGACRTGAFSYASAYTPGNYLLARDPATNVDFSFLNGPVVFNGLYASGWGAFYLDLYNGGNLVSSSTFITTGSNALVGTNAYSGQVDRVRVRLKQGQAVLGVDNVMFTPGQTSLNTPVDNLVNQPNATPEPATLLLVASGLGGVGAMVRRRRKAASQ